MKKKNTTDLLFNHCTVAIGQPITAQYKVKLSPIKIVLFSKISKGTIEGAFAFVIEAAIDTTALLLYLVFLSKSFVALHLKQQ